MINEKVLNDRVKLLEQELATVAEKCERMDGAMAELEDLKMQVNALKLFIGRRHPEFKKEFLEIFEKVKNG
jgi:hypothetical protein